MVSSNKINWEKQREWFHDMNDEINKHFIYTFNDCDVGSINIVNIDPHKKTFQGGIFCGDTFYLKHWINIWACLKLYYIAFDELGLEKSFAIILDNNKPALNLNKTIGYTLVEKTKESIGYYILTKQTFFKKSEKLRRYLINFSKQAL